MFCIQCRGLPSGRLSAASRHRPRGSVAARGASLEHGARRLKNRFPDAALCTLKVQRYALQMHGLESGVQAQRYA
eukprot:5609620-Pyramimonas_sp.AAC.1